VRAEVTEAEVEEVVEELGIEVDCTERAGSDEGIEWFRVRKRGLPDEVYILDMEEAREIACHAHIVGRRFAELNLGAARKAAKLIARLLNLKESREEIVFEHVLRAGPGYRLHEAVREIVPISEVWIRPVYKVPSYRVYLEDAQREIEILYKDFSRLPAGKRITLFKPDTEASGRTGEASIRAVFEECARVGSEVSKIVLYGFISLPALEVLKRVAESEGVELVAFPLLDISELAYNRYDMPIYGLDEGLWSAKGVVRKLGSVIDLRTLRRCLPEFPPGMDQPGDWSERQALVFTGSGYEKGDMAKHLRNSLSLLRRLRDLSMKQSWYRSWQEKAFRREEEALERALGKVGRVP